MRNLLRFILYLRANPKYKYPGIIFGGAYYRRGFIYRIRIWGVYIRRGLFSEFYGTVQYV